MYCRGRGHTGVFIDICTLGNYNYNFSAVVGRVQRKNKTNEIQHTGEIHMDYLLQTTFRLLLLFLLFVYTGADPLIVNVPVKRLVGARGHTVVLGCEFSPNFGENHDNSSLLVTWQRQEDNRVVHSFYHGRDQLDTQDPAYVNRTSLFLTELSKGNASVKIENMGIKDAGSYLCTVSTLQGTDKAQLQLDYGAFFTEPSLTIIVLSSKISVQYETEGFPKPEVIWKGGHGENLGNDVETNMFMEHDGLYTIKSDYTTTKNSLNVTFIVKNPLLHQYLKRSISYTGEPCSCFNQVIALIVIAFLLVVMTTCAFCLYCRKT